MEYDETCKFVLILLQNFCNSFFVLHIFVLMGNNDLLFYPEMVEPFHYIVRT